MKTRESNPERKPSAMRTTRAELGLSAPGGAPGAPRGWYPRGYLPHDNNPETIQSITFRLADSLAQSRLREMEAELANLPSAKVDAERRKKIEAWLDSGMDCCALRHPALASLMQDTLLKWDGGRGRCRGGGGRLGISSHES
jgi:type I restriction enzyme R subunit/putative DNA methylase